MSDAIDKRQVPRQSVEGVQGKILFAADGTVLNLSLDGLALETRCWLAVGRSYPFKLSNGAEAATVHGTVVWSRLARTERQSPGETAPVYNTGVQFDGALADDTRHALARIGESASVQVGAGLVGLLRAGGSERRFAVRELRQSGLLIETDFLRSPGSLFDLDLEIPEGGTARARVRVTEVREIGPAGSGPTVEMRVEFIDLSKEERSALRKMVRALAAG